MNQKPSRLNYHLLNWLASLYQRKRLTTDELLTLLILWLIALLLLSGCATLDCQPGLQPNWNALQTAINRPLSKILDGTVDQISFTCRTPF